MLRLKNLWVATTTAALFAAVACGGDDNGSSGDGDGDGDGAGGSGDGDGDGAGGSGDGDGDGAGGSGDGDGAGGTGGGEATAAYFNRSVTFPVCTLIEPDCETSETTAAEISAVWEDGDVVIFTDSPQGAIGYVDISGATPTGIMKIDVGGEPTSVAVKDKYALVGVDESIDFENPAGTLKIYDIEAESDTPVHTIDVGGQPDSIAVSPDGNYAVVVLENQRDEDLDPDGDGPLGEGDIPQTPNNPPGSVVVVDLSDATVTNWSGTDVALTGLADITAADDPEPEYVDINSANKAVVTLQENNALVIIDLPTAMIDDSFSAGTVSLTDVDDTEDDRINPSASIDDIPREPDGVSWISEDMFATADEGDWLGGSRGFTIFETDGTVVYTSGNTMEHEAIRLGHYPEGRSENKGNEPENIEYAEFDGHKFLFVNSERTSLVFVYDIEDPTDPVLHQVLPAALGPEGAVAVPSKNMLIVSSEEDERGVFRGSLNFYIYGDDAPEYPSVVSAEKGSSYIPWAALSGLAADTDGTTLYTIEDSAFTSNRILTIDTSSYPSVITDELVILDTNDVLAATAVEDTGDDNEDFSADDLAAMINTDKSVNIDPEGISLATGGGFWVASEGSGTFGLQDDGDSGDERPINTRNMIFKVSEAGVIEQVVRLPSEVDAIQLRFGFEGVAEYDGKLYVAFQRAWNSEAFVRIGIYDIETPGWEFVQYTLDPVASENGGWVGLSDITSLGDGTFLIVERDNQAGPDAAVKKLFTIDLSTYTDGDDVEKTLVQDILGDIVWNNNLAYEKIEGSAVDSDGNVWIINDNDGVNDNSGETALLNLGDILP